MEICHYFCSFDRFFNPVPKLKLDFVLFQTAARELANITDEGEVREEENTKSADKNGKPGKHKRKNTVTNGKLPFYFFSYLHL